MRGIGVIVLERPVLASGKCRTVTVWNGCRAFHPLFSLEAVKDGYTNTGFWNVACGSGFVRRDPLNAFEAQAAGVRDLAAGVMDVSGVAGPALKEMQEVRDAGQWAQAVTGCTVLNRT